MKVRNVTFVVLIGVLALLAACGNRQASDQPAKGDQPAQKKAVGVSGEVKAVPKTQPSTAAKPSADSPAEKPETAVEAPAGTASQDKMEILKQKTNEAVAAAKDVYEEKRAVLAEEFDEQYKALQTRLDQLKKDLAATSRKIEKKTDESLDLAEKKRAEAAQKLDEFKTSTEDTWDTLKKDTRTALADLQKAIDSLSPKKPGEGAEDSTAKVPPKDSKAADMK